MGAFISQGDTEPALTAALEQPAGVPIDLTGASVTLYAHHVGGLASITGACSVIDGPAGLVSYAWQSDDTAVAGQYHGEFAVSQDGRRRTVPNDAPFTLLVRARLG